MLIKSIFSSQTQQTEGEVPLILRFLRLLICQSKGVQLDNCLISRFIILLLVDLNEFSSSSSSSFLFFNFISLLFNKNSLELLSLFKDE